MTIFVEVVSERLEVSYSERPRQSYRTDLCTLIYEVASEPYIRGERSRWFGRVDRPPLSEWKGRPC